VQLNQDLLKLENPAGAIEAVENFLKGYVQKVAVEGVVFGMSGGLDSSVVAALCARALNDRNKVLGLCMPEEGTYNKQNIKDAEHIAEIFDVEFMTVDITQVTKAFSANLAVYDPKNRVANGNLKARVRAVTLYYYSNVLNRLVVGTTDKSEMMLG